MRGIGDAMTAVPVPQRALIGLLLAVVAIANIDPPYPDLAPLQHGPTVALLIAAPWLLRRWPLSTSAIAMIAGFLLLHTIGARYIYSYVPYAQWSDLLGGLIGVDRNGWDRLVHLAFGLLMTAPFAEWWRRHGRVSPRMAWFIAVLMIAFLSALYEVFEWLLTLVAAGETADRYNGQQGDIWDPQKDMALAMAGSVIACIVARASKQISRR